MNKNEFLKRLSGNLSRMSGEERDEIMADFAEYFDCAVKEGKDEETVCARLGDPKKIAKEYYSQKMIEEANSKKTFKSMGRAVAAAAGLSLSNFIYAVCVVAAGYIVIAALYIAVCSAGLAAFAALIGSAVYFSAYNPLLVLLGIFLSAALLSLCVIGFIGIMKLAALFRRGNMKFLNMTKRVILGGSDNE